MDEHRLRAWVAVLDDATYYQILGVDFSAEPEEVQDAFHRFAEAFHPDAHRGADEGAREAAETIFKRGVEAYRVLGDGRLRALYDEALSVGDVRPAMFSSMRPPPPAAEGIDVATVALAARPFASRAEELAGAGDRAQARLYVQLALFHDPANASLLAFRNALDERR